MADPIERVGKSVTILAAIIGVVISVNTVFANRVKTDADAVIAAAKLKSENYAAFRGAVTRDELYWQSLYDQFLTIFGKDFGAQPEARRAKLIALYTLAQHPLPSFDEFAVPAAEKRTALDRLTTMQAGLLNNIEEQGANDPLLAAELERRSYKGKAAEALPPAPGANPHAAAPTVRPAPAPPVAAPGSPPAATDRAGTIVTLSPLSATGWDLDIFWCEGPDAAANRSTAMQLGNAMAPLAKAGRSIAPGVTLGRIRVRPASIAFQQQPRSPAAGAAIIYDTRPGERQAAQALQSSFNTVLNADRFVVRGSDGAQTRWYLSAFVCAPAAGAAAGASADETAVAAH